MTEKRSILCLYLVLVLCCTASGTTLGTMELWFGGYGANSEVQIYGSGYNGDWRYAGVYMFETISATGDGNLIADNPFAAFCIEVKEPPPYLNYNYEIMKLEDSPNTTIGGTLGLEKAALISELFGRYYDPAWYGRTNHTAEENAQAEAFALAIWEIICEQITSDPYGWEVTFDGQVPGNFSASYYQTDLANTWLRSLDGTGPMAMLRALVAQGKQDYVVMIPEPATLALLSMGLIFVRHHRRKRQPAL